MHLDLLNCFAQVPLDRGYWLAVRLTPSSNYGFKLGINAHLELIPKLAQALLAQELLLGLTLVTESHETVLKVL